MVRKYSKLYFLLSAAVLLFRLDCWAQQSGGVTGSAEKSTGAISGRVINIAGEPLPGATVSAASLNGSRAQTATANNNGEFSIDGLEPGLYRLFAGMTGYVYRSPVSPNGTDYYRIGDSVTLTLIRGAVITGTVTGPNGPLIGVGVFATRVRNEEGEKLPRSVTLRERSTDDRGVFRIYGLLPGAYVLSAAKPRIGLVAPSPYDNDSPTYFPSGTRDTASEIMVRDGDEITADIQYRAEPGHTVSGRVTGVIESQTQFSTSGTITLINRQNQTEMVTGTIANENQGFAIYAVPDGEYEISAMQYLPTRDQLKSAPQRVTVRGGDVTGLNLTLSLLASIEGRLVFENDPRAPCAKRKETAAHETLVFARRLGSEKKTNADARGESSEVSVAAAAFFTSGVGDAKGSFTLRNLPSGSYQIDPRAPASGWYVKSIAIGSAQSAAAKTASLTTARDGIPVRSSERVTGLVVTFTEGASRLRGRISVAEGQNMPPHLAVYLVPAEPATVDNVLRFYETRPEADHSFTIDNINPGNYFIVARSLTEKDIDTATSIRRDPDFRSTISREAAAAKKQVSFKPCERIADYEIAYSP